VRHPVQGEKPWRGHKGKKADAPTPEQNRYNNELPKVRVVIERTISRLKKFRIREKSSGTGSSVMM
jgi:hypothetical protein